MLTSLSLDEANAVATPGTKDPDPDYSMIKSDEIDPVTNFADGQVYAFSSGMGEAFRLEQKSKSCGSPQRPLANLSHVKDGGIRSNSSSNMTLENSVGAHANCVHAVQNDVAHGDTKRVNIV